MTTSDGSGLLQLTKHCESESDRDLVLTDQSSQNLERNFSHDLRPQQSIKAHNEEPNVPLEIKNYSKSAKTPSSFHPMSKQAICKLSNSELNKKLTEMAKEIKVIKAQNRYLTKRCLHLSTVMKHLK